MGISITEYCYSEPQAGKSYCDLKIAHMRMKMKSYAASGHNILTAADMKHALDAGSCIYMYDFCLSQLCNFHGPHCSLYMYVVINTKLPKSHFLNFRCQRMSSCKCGNRYNKTVVHYAQDEKCK